MKSAILCAVALSAAISSTAQLYTDRWTIDNHSDKITLNIANNALPHSDHIEMSGKRMSAVLYWSLDSAAHFGLNRALVFPMLRTIPNDTHASLMFNNSIDIADMIRVAGRKVEFKTATVSLDGMMYVISEWNGQGNRALELMQTISPSVDKAALIESFKLRNSGSEPLYIEIPSLDQTYITEKERGVAGAYIIESKLTGNGAYRLAPNKEIDFQLVTQAYAPENGEQAVELKALDEIAHRRAIIAEFDSSLVLETPDKVLDTEFRFAKIRGAESIYETKGGLMHGPGGESYYAAIWANDQAEYINPFFPFLGYDTANKSALNCFEHYARFMNDEYKPLPCSIIAEGDDIWAGAGDRGDAAMIAYGASRYALARADVAEAKRLWPLIQWCLEYCRRKINEDGVVASDCDELERRFPAGDANLCTASLYYDALLSAAYLAHELGMKSNVITDYRRQANEMRQAIEHHFGANIQGFDTYRYYDENDLLRSWICIPLVMGINDRAEQTVRALFSPQMYTDDGVLTCQGSNVFWDRATLYTLRGALCAGYPDEAISKLSALSRRRLLGDHVPYPVEAWPEGSQRHLSAESGLYCRVITEGMFGIRPTGMHSFLLKPQLPSGWDYARLKHIKAFGSDFDIDIKRLKGNRLQVIIVDHINGHKQQYKTNNGHPLNIKIKKPHQISK